MAEVENLQNYRSVKETWGGCGSLAKAQVSNVIERHLVIVASIPDTHSLKSK